MSWWRNHWRALLCTGGILLLLLFFVLILPRMQVPAKQSHSYLILAGNVSRAIVMDSRSSSRTGKPSLPRLPHHLEFESTNGPVEVYVLDFSDRASREQVNDMLHATNELIAGHPPADYIAMGAGQSGRIELHAWPYGTAKYVVLIHAPQESNVVLEVHYGP